MAMKEAMEWLWPKVGDRIRFLGDNYMGLKTGCDYTIEWIYPFNSLDPVQKATGHPKMRVMEVRKYDDDPDRKVFMGDVYFTQFYPLHAVRRFVVPGIAASVMDGVSIRPDQYQVQSTFILSHPWFPEPQKRKGDPEDYNMMFLSLS